VTRLENVIAKSTRSPPVTCRRVLAFIELRVSNSRDRGRGGLGEHQGLYLCSLAGVTTVRRLVAAYDGHNRVLPHAVLRTSA
jgi:hypothetical protein